MHAPFIADIDTIRRRARDEMAKGPITEAYGLDPARVVDVLNQALATEIVCTLRYRNHYFVARGIHSESVAGELLQHSNEEQQHADALAGRIAQLGGVPNFNPEGLATRAHAEYREGATLTDMLREDLVAERIAIETYAAIVRWLGTADPTTRRLMEGILEKEEEHADDLFKLLDRTPGD